MASIEDLKELLSAGGNPNDIVGGKSYIHHCIDEDNGKMVSYLIEKGADPNTPKCTEYLPPIHYAIKNHKNKAVLALLESQADPNYRTSSGNVPLTTAIIAGNDQALYYLIQFEADPNITNSRGEIPLFHAINKGNYKAVNLLLENNSECVVGSKSAIHYAAKKGEAECLLILLRFGCRKSDLDSHDRRPIDLAMDVEDPTCELLLRAHNIPETTLDSGFVAFLKDSFEPAIETLRDQIADGLEKTPRKLQSFISRMMELERCHFRFVQFLKRRHAELGESIEALSRPTQANLDEDIDRLSVQFANTFMKEIELTGEEQRAHSRDLFSPNGLEAHARWVRRTEELQAFIAQLVADGLDKFGLKDDVAARLRRATKDREFVGELLKETAGKTVPFQEEIVEFVIVTMHRIRGPPPHANLDVVTRHFKMLLKQIEVSNPELIRRQFKRAK